MNNDNLTSVNDESLVLIYAEESKIEAKDVTFGPVVRNCYIIECCTGGLGSVIINGKEFNFREGDCYVLMPNDKVSHKTFKESSRRELTCFVRGIEIKRAVRLAGITSDDPFIRAEAYPEICESIRKLVALIGEKSIKADYSRTAEVYKIMSALVDDKQRIEAASIIKRASNIMENEYIGNLTVEKIAKRVGLERGYFSVLFRKHTGQTPHAYLTTVRIKQSCRLLSITDLSVSDIALQVGLEPEGFARIFKREIGVTPVKFRKKN